MISSHSQGFYCSITSYMKCTTHHTRLHVLVLMNYAPYAQAVETSTVC